MSLTYSDSDRLNFLHTINCDTDGYAWGVARVKNNEAGQPMSVLWGLSDCSDLDAVMEQHGVKPRIEAVIDTCDLGHVFAKVAGYHPHTSDGKPRCPNCMAQGLDAARKKPDNEIEGVHAVR